MSKLQRIKTMLSELLELEMSSATSDKGVLYWNEETIEVGTTIYVQNENDIKVLAEDGDYEIDGKVYSVSDGKVTEITDKVMPVSIVPEEPEEPAEPEVVEEPEAVEPEVIEEPEQVEEPEETPEPEEEEPLAEEEKEDEEPVEDVKEEDDELRKQIDELREIVEVLKAELEALKGKPLAMSAAEEFQVLQKNAVTKGIGRYADAIAQLRKN